ncbi:PepSY-associated TM helix domain-containing protein [Paraglaciecola sp. 2405UD69-4]|uniref:PepSY-associated TM helix domain-containing protein n=1 Tax=Paraglaciecola sp. 2405UD69-4 TaxID=3391836 RepID=UPI0039C98B8A
MQNPTQLPVPTLTKRSLSAHTWLGLFVSAFMYIICLSGTLTVFHQELERWEQPNVIETTDFDIATIEQAYDNFVNTYSEETEHMHVVFPTSGIPRLVIEDDHVAHFVNSDGSLGDTEQSYWTKMLEDLHFYLHLPKSFGMILVSAFGALLCALMLSGFFAHPRIIKDAFRFRRGGTGLQENIDLHNRFSVWASPFHLMIGITGAYFGLATILIVLVSQAFYEGNNQTVIDEVFPPEPILEQAIVKPQIGKAINYVQTNKPDAELIFLTVHEPNTKGQFIEIYTKMSKQLVYSENFRFDADGNYINQGDYRTLSGGKKLIYSMYRLHFGDFLGMPTKILYFILGIMLTIVSATGINIWLKKRKKQDLINQWWPTLVWGTPVALCISATINLYFATRLDAVIWVTLVIALAASKNIKNIPQLIYWLKQALIFTLFLFIVCYSVKHGSSAFNFAALQINVPLALYACYLFIRTPKPNLLT